MAATLARCLQGACTTLEPVEFIFEPDHPFNGYPYKWKMSLAIENQLVSIPTDEYDFAFNATDIKVGDWVAAANGFALKVYEIVEVTDPFTAVVLVQDDNYYNTLSDPTSTGNGAIQDGPCVVFETGANGLPIIGPLPVDKFVPSFQGDIISRFVRTYVPPIGGGGGGGSDTLTETSSGSYDDGYIKGWSVGTTLVSDAFRALNVALTTLGPAKPQALNQQFLDIEGGVSLLNSDPIVLAKSAANLSGVPDEELPPAGSVIKRVRVDTVNTTEVGPFGPGNSGNLALSFNNVSAGGVDLSIGDNSGSYNLLEITSDGESPFNQPGFYEAITARGVGLQPQPGVNMVHMSHSSGTETRKAFFVYDTSSTRPEVDAVSVTLTDVGTLEQSSGIPHLSRGTRLKVSGTVDNLATDIALGRRNVLITTTPVAVGPTTWLSGGSFGLSEVFTKGSPETFVDAEYVIDDTENNPAYGSVQMSITGRNANGGGEYVHPIILNVMRGGIPTELSFLEELNVPVYNLGTPVEGKPLFAYRTGCASTEPTPADDVVFTQWASSNSTANNEASVVGGAAIRDKNNYSEGYLPLGPDYTGKDDVQYITFVLHRKAVSQMIMQVRGSYSKCFIKLPGIEAQPLSVNGWMDAMKLYDGSGVPGRDSEDGCALGKAGYGFDQDLRITFGPESSSNSTDNRILIRFTLSEGNAITALRFTGVE